MTSSLNTFYFHSVFLSKRLPVYLSHSEYEVEVFYAAHRLVNIALISEAVILLLMRTQQVFHAVLENLENAHVAYLVWISEQIAATSVGHVVAW